MKRIFMRGNPGDFANYVAALTACGAEPVISMTLSDADTCDGLLIPGGADVNPVLYGQENTASEGIDDSRDADEIALAKCFFAAGKPVFGICRGHQVLNVAFGGDLIQDVPDPQHHMATKETGDAIHTVRAQHDLMREFYGEEFPVNSAHHQAVWRLGTGLQVFACAEDGTVEAVGHRTLPVFAVQWHPERLCGAFARPESADGAKLLHTLLR